MISIIIFILKKTYMSFKTRYNIELLNQIIERDQFKTDISKYESIHNFNRNTRIHFICFCGEEGNKIFRQINNFGGFCKSCTEKNRKEKNKLTCLEKYGVEHVFQIEVVKEKKKSICLEKYGVEYISQSKEIKEKIKTTCLEKYGVEYHTQNETVKKKSRETCLEKYGVEYSLQSKKVREKSKETCLEKYGVEHISQSDVFKEKFKTTCLEKYGVKHILQSEVYKEKFKTTCLEKYGFENPFVSEEIKEKIRETCLEKYGVENSMQSEKIREKSRKTCLEKYGVENPFKSEIIKSKIKTTCLEKYGVEYALQNSEIAEKASKNAYKLKTFIFDSGEEIKVQGYEPLALKILVDNGYTFNNIITSRIEVPEIWYKKDTGTNHRYYCDIFIPSENRIIEVKSTWTYEKDKEDIPLKHKACEKAGYEFELWVFDDKQNKVL